MQPSIKGCKQTWDHSNPAILCFKTILTISRLSLSRSSNFQASQVDPACSPNFPHPTIQDWTPEKSRGVSMKQCSNRQCKGPNLSPYLLSSLRRFLSTRLTSKASLKTNYLKLTVSQKVSRVAITKLQDLYCPWSKLLVTSSHIVPNNINRQGERSAGQTSRESPSSRLCLEMPKSSSKAVSNSTSRTLT